MNTDKLFLVAEEAMRWGKERHTDRSQYQHAVFANSVVYARFRMTGPYGGPSLREHVANARLNGALIDWQETVVEEIYLFLVSPCYGALTEEHLRFWRKYQDLCRDDDPEDLRVLDAHAGQLKFATTRVWSSTLDNMRRVAALRDESIVETWDRMAKEELVRLRQQL